MWYNIFLEDIPWANCPTAGHAAYSDAVRVVQDFDQPINDPNFPPKTVKASNFMVYHTILKTSKDYYEALRWARKLTDEIGNFKNYFPFCLNLTQKIENKKSSEIEFEDLQGFWR